MKTPVLDLTSIQAARRLLAGGIALTPCLESAPLTEITGARIFCKFEQCQRTGSFKERGARHALLRLTPARRARGVIAASAGNHAQGLACHGGLLGVPVTVVMPRGAPAVKIGACRRFGATVVLVDGGFEAARRRAEMLAAETGLTRIHPFDDAHVIAGQGTLALEILEQVPGVEAVLVPVGGAGLIAGMAIALKALRPAVRVIGVEPAAAPSFSAALAAGRPVTAPVGRTLADGLAVARVGALGFALAAPLVDRVVTVTEDDLARAIRWLAERAKCVVEGAGAAPLAALLSGQLPELAGRCVALPLCGGNIDPVAHSRAVARGMAAEENAARPVLAETVL